MKTDIAKHLEKAADALPDRHFSKTGELLSGKPGEPNDDEDESDDKPDPAPKSKR